MADTTATGPRKTLNPDAVPFNPPAVSTLVDPPAQLAEAAPEPDQPSAGGLFAAAGSTYQPPAVDEWISDEEVFNTPVPADEGEMSIPLDAWDPKLAAGFTSPYGELVPLPPRPHAEPQEPDTQHVESFAGIGSPTYTAPVPAQLPITPQKPATAADAVALQVLANTLEAHANSKEVVGAIPAAVAPPISAVHPIVSQHERKKSEPVSDPWSRAERDMAKRNPAGWKALADAGYKTLVEIYYPEPIPKESLDAHLERYADAYKGTGGPGAETVAPTMVISPEVPANLQGLAAAGAAMGAMHSTPVVKTWGPPSQYISPQTPELSHKRQDSIVTEDSDKTITPKSALRTQQALLQQAPQQAPQQALPQAVQQAQIVLDPVPKPFSPGPAFPALDADRTQVPPRRPVTPFTNDPNYHQVTTYQIHEESQQHTPTRQGIGPIPYPGGPVPYSGTGAGITPSRVRQHEPNRRQPSGRFQPFELQHDVRAPVLPGTYLRHGDTPRGGRRMSKRRIRTDQGPLPSSADIYPDDMEPVDMPQEEVRPTQGIMGFARQNLFSTPMQEYTPVATIEDISPLPTYFLAGQTVVQQPTPQPTVQQPAIQHFGIPPPRTAWIHDPRLATATTAATDGISDLQNPSPLSDLATLVRDSEEIPQRGTGPDRLSMQLQRGTLTQDQIDGTRYGLNKFAPPIGLNRCGDVWLPPGSLRDKKKEGPFANVGYLWGQ